MIEKEIVDYIFNNYGSLFTKEEKLAKNHLLGLYRNSLEENPSPSFLKRTEEHYFTKDPYALQLLECGEETFRQNVAKRILDNEKIFLNYCPICGTLARTKIAKQCKNGHRWE